MQSIQNTTLKSVRFIMFHLDLKKKKNEKIPQIHTKLFVQTRSNVTRVHRLTPYPGHSKIRSVGHPLQLFS